MKVSHQDRAIIIGSVVKDIFRPGRNYEGEHFLLASGLRAEWIPKIPNYNLRLITQNEIESSARPIYYYVLRLRPQKRFVHVNAFLYDSENKSEPHVILFYRYHRVGNRWRGGFRYGGGD